MKVNILLARFPGDRREDPDCVDWLIQTVVKMKMDQRIEAVHHFQEVSTPITMLRNLAVEEAKRLGCDYILMIDNDIEPDPKEYGHPLHIGAMPFWDTAFEFMLKTPTAGCIAAPYCGPSPWNNIYIFQWQNKNNKNNDVGHDPTAFFGCSLDQFTRQEAATRGGIEEVGALPTGLALYRTSAFNGMPYPYFDYEWKGDGAHCEKCGQPKPGPRAVKASTEDVYQTREMSMAWYSTNGKVGGRIFCAWDCWATHIKHEKVRKPELLSVSQVSAAYRNAVKQNMQVDEKIVNVQGRIPPEIMERMMKNAIHVVPPGGAGSPVLPGSGDDLAARMSAVIHEGNGDTVRPAGPRPDKGGPGGAG